MQFRYICTPKNSHWYKLLHYKKMIALDKQLEVKKSTIENAGLGLFTKIAIAKGTTIIEYKGKVTSWDDADHMGGDNPYLFCVTKKHTIDGSKDPKAIAKYANDAKGLTRVKGVKNNCEYVIYDNNRVFIDAKKDIPAGSEILVGYGKDYWKTIKKNIKINKKEEAKKVATSA